MKQLHASWAEKAALACFLLLTMVIAIGMIGFFFQIPIGGYTLVIALLLLAIPMALRDRRLLGMLVLVLILLAIWCLICQHMFDHSFDGMYYHKQAIITLKEGWIPLQGSSADADIFATYLDEALWLDNYPKGIWIFSAVIYSITNLLETAKAVNLLFFLPVFLLGYDVLRTAYGYSCRKSLIFSLLIGMNPVFLCQLFTSYNDIAVGSLIIIAALLCFKIYHGCATVTTYLLCFCTAAISCAVKFTAPFYVGLVFLVYGVCYGFSVSWDFSKLWRPILTLACGFLIGTCLLGFDPYVKHLAQGQHMLYPVMGEGKYDIMNVNPPKTFDQKNNIERLALSLISQTNNDISEAPKPKIPFYIDPSELQNLEAADNRIGGFGVWFSGILILSAVFLFIAVIHRTKWRTCTLIGLLLFTGFALFMPQTWWARYASYIYYIPIFILFYISDDKQWQWKVWVMCALIAVNSLMVMWFNVAGTIRTTHMLQDKLAEIKSYGQKVILRVNDFPSHVKLFEEAEIPFEVSHQPLENDAMLFYGTTKYQLEPKS